MRVSGIIVLIAAAALLHANFVAADADDDDFDEEDGMYDGPPTDAGAGRYEFGPDHALVRRVMTGGEKTFKGAKKELFAHFDENGDGSLEQAEYLRFIAAFAAEEQLRAGRPEADVEVTPDQLEEAWEAALRGYDKQRTGLFSLAQFGRIIDDLPAQEML